MRVDDFALLLGLLARLTVEQKKRLGAALAAGDRHQAVLSVLEERLGPNPVCLHCRHEQVQRWGFSHGLQRWRCRSCQRSFNALTGTALARLRKRAEWLTFAETLSEGLSVQAAAERCRVAPSTSFRWRHRFLCGEVARTDELGGIVEADETFFRLSFKGSRQWRGDAASRPKRPPKRRGTKPQASGLTIENVPVLVARDRQGATRSIVLEDRSADAIDKAIGAALPKDGILCSDGWRGYASTARKRGIHHETINVTAGERCRDGIWHIQNANAHHSRLKAWVARFKGIATHYLPAYLAWHHVLDKSIDRNREHAWLKLALNS